MQVTITHNLGQVSTQNAAWLRQRGQQLLREVAKAELRREQARRGRDARFFTTVDRRPNKPIDAATQIVVLDFPGTQQLNVGAVLSRLQELVYAVADLTRRTGQLGSAWSWDVWRAAKKAVQHATGSTVDLQAGDNVRILSRAFYAAPLSSLIARGRLHQFFRRKQAKGQLAGVSVVHVKRTALSRRGLSSLLANALRRLPELTGFQTIGRYLRKPAGNRVRTSIAVDIKLGRLKIPRRPRRG